MTTNTQQTFKIQRTFDAPIEKVWDARTDPAQFQKWWMSGKATFLRSEIHEGATTHYRIDGEMGSMWGIFRYVKLEKPHVIEFVVAFSNEQGEIVKAPFAMDYPLEVLTRITLNEQNGKTTFTLESHPINATPEQEATFASMRENMDLNFGMTLDLLGKYLQETR